jgi:hypothetical protein
MKAFNGKNTNMNQDRKMKAFNGKNTNMNQEWETLEDKYLKRHHLKMQHFITQALFKKALDIKQ